MLATRIIPTMLVRGKQLVKGQQFNSWRSIGHAAQAAQIHASRGVDELCILDISPKGRPNLALIKDLSQWCFTPLTVGGGVMTMHDISNLMQSGADKVMICSGAREVEFITQASSRYGSQAIVVAVDYRYIDGFPCVMIGSGKEKVEMLHDDGPGPMHPVAWASRMEDLGAGEIMLTCIDREGMMEGYDLDMIDLVASQVEIPVIAHGGCGTPYHALEALDAGADAVAIGAMFCFTDETPRSVAEYLNSKGKEVRL